MMRSTLRRRFWLEMGMTACAMLLAVITVVRRDWIELVFGTDPDAHSGILEWVIVAGLVALIIGLSVLARYEWSRASAAAKTLASGSASPISSAS